MMFSRSSLKELYSFALCLWYFLYKSFIFGRKIIFSTSNLCLCNKKELFLHKYRIIHTSRMIQRKNVDRVDVAIENYSVNKHLTS